MPRAAIYCRISNDPDRKRKGVERQEKDSRELCADHGFSVIEPPFVDSDISAADPTKDRPAYRRMMAAVQAGDVDVVVVSDPDRLHRQPVEVDEFIRDYLAAGLDEVLTDSGGSYSLGDANGEYQFRDAGKLAKREVTKLSRRVKRKKLELAQAGKPSGGRRPFGFEGDGETVRESEAALIRAAATRILSGGSVRSTRDEWRATGVETTTQERWRLTEKGTPGQWSTSTIRQLLLSPRMAGLRQHQGEVMGEAAWPAILDRDTWEQLRAVLTDPSRRPAPASHKYPLKGILRCAQCGTTLSGTPKIKDGKSVAHYSCRKESGGCGLTVSARAIERHIFALVLPLADSPAMRDLIAADEAGQADEARRLVAENAEDEKTIVQLDTDYYEERVIDRARWIKQTQRLRARIDERHSRLGALRGRSALDRLGGHVRETWDNMNAEDKRAVVSTFVPTVRVKRPTGYGSRFDPKRISVTWRIGEFAKASVGLWDVMTDEEKEQALEAANASPHR